GEQQRLALRRDELGKRRDELAHDEATVLMRRMRQRFGDCRVDRHARALTAQAGNELIALNSEQPRREIRAGLEAVATGQGLDHRVVDQVVGCIAIAGRRQRIDPQPRRYRLELVVKVLNVGTDFGGHRSFSSSPCWPTNASPCQKVTLAPKWGGNLLIYNGLYPIRPASCLRARETRALRVPTEQPHSAAASS